MQKSYKNYEKMGTDGGLKEEMVVMVENVDIVEAAKMEESMGPWWRR